MKDLNRDQFSKYVLDTMLRKTHSERVIERQGINKAADATSADATSAKRKVEWTIENARLFYDTLGPNLHLLYLLRMSRYIGKPAFDGKISHIIILT